MVQIIEPSWSSNCQTDATKWVWTEWTPNSFMTTRAGNRIYLDAIKIRESKLFQKYPAEICSCFSGQGTVT